MKLIALATALAFASPAIAQDMADGAAQQAAQQSTAPAPQQTGATPPPTDQPEVPTDGMTTGAGTITAHDTATAQQPPATTGDYGPPEAAPAPTPRASYPPCSRNVKDNCRQPR